MENVSAIFEGLNNEQKNAVGCVDGPVLIVAGAGSGKTRVLTSRIAYILEKGCGPERILALTFTKKAAAEMKERIALMTGQWKARKLYMGTFHSVFIRFLREFSVSLGYPENFTIYDTGDSVSAIKACLKELKLDDKVYKPKDVLSRISMAKNNLVTVEAYRRNTQALQNDAAHKKPRIVDVYDLYQKKMKQSGVMDFDDILMNMNRLLCTNPEACESISGRFDYVLVDEYQDTNMSQYLILKKLCEKHRNLCVVGDDSQSIYAFRGAKVENILRFSKDYPECRTFRLEQNYRSTQTIVDAANSVIEKNEGRIKKRCFSAGEKGEPIRIIQAYTDGEEAQLVASSIVSRIRSEHAEYKDFAILYRTNSQSRAFEEAFRKRNLPYVIYSGNSFYERAEVKDMMAYLKLACNLKDDESFKRIVNKPARGIGDTSLNALITAASDKNISLFEAVLSDDLANYGLRAAALDKIRSFCRMMAEASSKIPVTDAHKLAVSISVDSGIYMMYKGDNSIEGQSKASNIEELLNSIKSYVEERNNDYFEEMQIEAAIPDGTDITDMEFPVVTLNEYLENVSLLSAVDMEDDENGSNKITMMTIHSSKGLEFPYVYVVGLEENLFPSGGFTISENELEEERRLFYVAITRAGKAVELSYSSTRMRNGKTESNPPSRFITEIDSRYLANPIHLRSESIMPVFSRNTGISYKSATKNVSQPRNIPVPKRVNDADFKASPIHELAEGQRVEHNRFGYGKIVEISGSPTDLKARIRFDEHGEKVLLLKYAKIRVL